MNTENVKFSMNITQNDVSFINDKTIKKNAATEKKIKKLSIQLYSDIKKYSKTEVKNLTLIFSSIGELKLIVKNDLNEIEYNLDSLSKNSKKKALEIVTLLKKTGIFSAADTKISPQPIVQTHHRLLSEISDKATPESVFKRGYKFFLRFFAFHLTVGPLALRMVRNAVRKTTPENLKDLYTQPDALFKRIKEKMIAENPVIKDLYTDEELDTIINTQLIKDANNKLGRAKRPKWNRDALYRLDILRIIEQAKANKLPTESYKIFSKINPLDIPLEDFVKIPLAAENEKVLTEIWKQLTANLFTKGALDRLNQESDLSGIIVQTEYAQNYLKALELIPPPIKEILNPFLDELNQKQSVSALRDFLVQHFVLTDSTIELKDREIQLEHQIYNDKIRPHILEFIQKKMEGEKDAEEVISLLSSKDGTDDILEVVEKIQSGLTEETEKKHFNEIRIFELIVHELERVAVFDYHMTTQQLANLKNERNEWFFGNFHTKELEDALNVYESEIKILETTYQGEELLDNINELKDEFLNYYDDLLNEHISILALGNISQNLGAGDVHGLNLVEEMWKQAINKSFKAGRLDEIQDVIPQDNTFQKRLKPYIIAKLTLNQLSDNDDFPIFFSQSLQKFVSNLEDNIVNPQVNTALDVASEYYEKYYSDDEAFLKNELLINDDILKEVQKSTQESIISKEQQICLMNITKIINFVDSRELTSEESAELHQLLTEAKTFKNLRGVLKHFLEGGEREGESLLKPLPWFLQGILKKFIPASPVIEGKKEQKIPAGVSLASLRFLDKYLSKTQNIDKVAAELIPLQDKALDLLQKYTQNPQSIDAKDRLTLGEIGKIINSARLSNEKNKDNQDISFISTLINFGLIEGNKDLEKLANISNRSETLLQELDKIIRPEINSHYKSGDVLAFDAKKKSSILNRPLGVEERLTSFISNGLTHGAKLVEKNGQIEISHIYGDYEIGPLDLFSLCISDVWEIDLTALVPNSMQNILKQVYGDEWSKKLNEMYQSVEKEMHKSANFRFKKVGNNQERRIAAGIADHPFLMKMLGKSVEGHTRANEKDFNKIHDKFFGWKTPDEDQICSEWATKATLAAMVETNKRIVKDIQEKLGDQYNAVEIFKKLQEKKVAIPRIVEDYLNGVRYWDTTKKDAKLSKDRSRAVTQEAEKQLIKILKKQGYSSQDIQLIIRLGNEEIFDFPYSRKERLKAVHPGRMAQLLVDKKCAKRKSPPKALMALVAV